MVLHFYNMWNAHNSNSENTDSVSLAYPYHRHNDRRQKITINVAGKRFQTFVETLDRFPKTLLGNPLKREEFYDEGENEYFFDRDRSAFNAILYYYQSNGQLYCPITVPMTILVTEAKFFDLPKETLTQVLDLGSDENDKEMPKNKWQRKLWCLFEYPETSRSAEYLTLFTVLMILFSVTQLCIETLPFAKEHIHQDSYQVDSNTRSTSSPPYEKHSLNLTYRNRSILNVNNTKLLNQQTTTFTIKLDCICDTNIPKKVSKTNSFRKTFEDIDWHKVFSMGEAVFVAWFTIEFIIRFATCPNKIEFLKTILNIIDIVSILPFYITTALNKTEGLGLENLRVVRLVRVFRIFKLSRHSKGLQTLGKTLGASMKALGLMIFFLAIGVILFSSAVYYLEADNFSSIPDAFWWAIITMTTVGYGDKVPKTFTGKLVGSACAICGVLSIALPVPVIVSNFDYFYNQERTKKIHQDLIADTETDINTIMNTVASSSDTVAEDEETVASNNESDTTATIKFSRIDLIQRHSTLKGLEKRNREMNKKLEKGTLEKLESNI